MKPPHMHAAVIKAWADGAQVEYRYADPRLEQTWHAAPYSPSWTPQFVYRVKPEPKPDVVLYGAVNIHTVMAHLDKGDTAYAAPVCYTPFKTSPDQFKLVFDGETARLKAVEVL